MGCGWSRCTKDFGGNGIWKRNAPGEKQQLLFWRLQIEVSDLRALFQRGNPYHVKESRRLQCLHISFWWQLRNLYHFGLPTPLSREMLSQKFGLAIVNVGWPQNARGGLLMLVVGQILSPLNVTGSERENIGVFVRGDTTTQELESSSRTLSLIESGGGSSRVSLPW